MEMNVEFYAPADLPPGRKPPEPMQKGNWMVSKGDLRAVRNLKWSVPVQKRNADSQNVHPII